MAKQKQSIARHSEEEGGLRDMFISVDPQKLFYYNMAALFIVPALLWGFTSIIRSSSAIPTGSVGQSFARIPTSMS